MTAPASPRPPWEVADVIRRHGDAFLRSHGRRLTAPQKRALHDLARCRTAALGGHVAHCLDCGSERIAYNSCRNRHCPKCQALSRARWLAKEAAHLLPVEYFHVVFTLPAEVAEWARANPVRLYDLLFRAAAGTLHEVAANPRRLGARIGVLLVLHTWGQNLHHHPHVHAVVTGGGLSCLARGGVDPVPVWKACRPGFFLPVRVLGRVFRRLYLDGLRRAFAGGTLIIPGRLPGLADAPAFAAWLAARQAEDWVVYAQRPFGGPGQVLKYLARYVHRVAISNSRITHVDGHGVTFRYKDYADDHQSKVLTLSGEEFLRRFVGHVLPKGFVKVRHYGLLAPRDRDTRLAVCRRLLAVDEVRARLASAAAGEGLLAPVVEPRCPQCGGRRLVRRELPRPPATNMPPPDTS
jgi:Putative transposase/Transposase zinc-binding domain